jgi:PAS domain S-box-containing protein
MRLTPACEVLYANPASAPLLEAWQEQEQQTIPVELQKAVQEAFDSGVKKEVELGHRGKIFLCTLVPIREAGYINLYGNDITVRKRAVNALRESEERFRALVSQATAGIAQSDIDTRLIFVNPRFCEMLGYSESELIGKTIWELTYQDDLEENRNLYDRLLRQDEAYQIEKRFVRGDGSILWANVSVTMIRDEAGNPMGGVGVVTDISARKRAEWALAEFARQQEALYRLADELQHTNSLEDVYSAALNAILNALLCERASILLFDDTGVMRFVAWRGLSEEYRKVTEGHSLWTPDTDDPQPLCVSNLQASELSDSLKTVIQQEGIGSLVFIPLVSNGRLVGKFMAYFNKPHNCSDGEIELSLTIARQLAFGIDQKSADKQLRESAEYDAFRLTLTDALRPLSDPQKILAEAMRVLGEKLQVDRVLYSEIGNDDETILILDNYVREGVARLTGRAALDDYSKARKPLSTGRNLIVVDADTSPDMDEKDRATFAALGIRSGVAIPLIKGGRWAATLGIHHSHVRDWTDNEIKFMEETAERTWSALERARAQEDLRASEAKLQVELADTLQLQSISSQFIREDNIKVLYEQIINAAIALMRSDMASLQMFHPEKNELQLLAWKGFDPKAALFWEWVRLDSSTTCAIALQKIERVIVTDLEQNDFIRGTRDYEFFQLSGIRAVQTTPLISRSGNIVGMISTHWRNVHQPSERELRLLDVLARQAADLIERKQNEEALRTSKERYRRIVETANEGIWYIDLNAETVYSNEPMARLLGCSVEEILGHRVPEFCFPEDVPIVQERILANYQGNYEHFDFRFRRKDGEEVLVLASTSPVFDAAGRIAGALGMFVDVTERKRIEDALRIENERFMRFMNSNIVGILIGNANGDVVLANDYYLRLLGVTRQDLIEQKVDWKKFTPAEWAFADEKAIQELRERGVCEPYEKEYVRADGTRVPVYIADAMLPGSGEEIAAFVLDITDRKRAEQALERERQLLERLFETMPVMVSMYDPETDSMQLNTEFERLLGWKSEEVSAASLLQSLYPDPEYLKHVLERMAEAGKNDWVEVQVRTRDGRVLDSLWSNVSIMNGQKLIKGIAMGIDITERKRAEDALKQSEERFVRFMQHLPGLAWIKDVQGRYVFANATAEKAFGTPREQLYGKTDTEIFPPEVATQFKQNDERALFSETGMQTVEILPQEDGIRHYSLVTKFPIPDADGSPALIGGTAFDITERLQAEEDGRLIFVNQAFCNMLGYTEQELLGKTTWEFTHPDDVVENQRLYKRLMMEGIPFKLEKRLIRADGSILWVDVSVDPVMDAKGNPESAVAVEVDITARKQAEEALQQLNNQLESRVQKRTATIQAINRSLREEIAERRRVEEALRHSEAAARSSEEKLHTLFDLLPVGITFLDPDGKILQINSAVTDIVRLSKEQLITGTYKTRKYVRADGMSMPLSEFASARALRENKTIYNVETGIILESGEVLWTSVSAAPVDIEGVGVVVVTVDITDTKRAEQALKDSHRRLRILSQRLVEVQEEERRALARELHDRVGQTLAALNINLIIINGQLSSEVAQLIGGRLNDSMKFVAETIALVRDVMTDLRPAVLDDYGLEAALESQLSKFTSRYNIKVVFDKPEPPLPRLGSSVEMTFMRIAQEALMNIARHAQAETVRLALRQDKDEICMSIHDDGIGIESWQDANRPGSHGLTIMRERADAFGGKLRVSSVPGQGTTVEVMIPYRNDAQEKS